ncbi:MAG TPA: pentapeptide repeat-containing protein [Pyrinomonadaceae bacterium]
MLHYPGKDKSRAFSEVLKRKRSRGDFDFRGVWFADDVDFSNFKFNKPADFEYAAFTGRADFSKAMFNADASFAYAEFTHADFKFATFGRVSFRSASFKVFASFHYATFGKRVTFKHATFGAPATPGRSASTVAYFSAATFAEGASFERAAFGTTANFSAAAFGGAASFASATFGGAAYFSSASFGEEADFTFTTFASGVLFTSATFKDYTRFLGGVEKFVFSDEKNVFDNNSSLNLQFAKIDKPDHLSFHTLKLRPHWFVNVDARRFDFSNVDWDWPHTNVRTEIKSIAEVDVRSAHRLLAIACRDLADNAEENHRYEEASKFRFMAMEARRLERWRGFAFWTLDWWYCRASGYGESISRALLIFIAIWLGFAFLYRLPEPARCSDCTRSIDKQNSWTCFAWDIRNPQTNCRDISPEKYEESFFDDFFRSAVYTIESMTLQKPEPRPLSTLARLTVLLCTILGPVQAALLALAIRRKFMR